MITEDIINELDKFITNYKTLKSDNQNLNRFKTDVKTALNSKGIINTSEDSEVINSVNTYTPPTGGGAPLDADYLKKVGLLPEAFTGTPTEKDLIVNNFLFQDSSVPTKFLSSNLLTDVSMKLDGVAISNFRVNRTSSTSNNPSIDRSKYTITNNGYYINEFILPQSGNYNIVISDGSLSLEKTFNYKTRDINADNYLIYEVNIKSLRNICYDANKVETIGNLDPSKLDSKASSLFNRIVGNLNGMGYGREKLGYVYNARTGKAHLVNVKWVSSEYARIDPKYRKSLTTMIDNNKVYVNTSQYYFYLSVPNSSEDKFIEDINYKDGDTLVFAFFKDKDDIMAHNYHEEVVAEYLKKVFKSMPKHVALEDGE